MPHLRANGIRLEYDTFGDIADRPLLLIMGLGAQMLQWDEQFCTALAERGHYVIRFDNRDVGLSEKFDHAGVPDLAALMQPGADLSKAPYTVADMADDAAGVLSALGLDSAHIFGASMGGMIAQTVAYRHPARTRSLISLYASTGNPQLPPAKPEAMAVLMMPRPQDREGAIAAAVNAAQVTSGSQYPIAEDYLRQRAAAMFDRATTPAATPRQIAAIATHGYRPADIASITAPTLVIHGTDDPLVSVEGGRDTARTIAGAKLVEIEGMGHGIPPALWTHLADLVAAHTRMAEAGHT